MTDELDKVGVLKDAMLAIADELSQELAQPPDVRDAGKLRHHLPQVATSDE